MSLVSLVQQLKAFEIFNHLSLQSLEQLSKDCIEYKVSKDRMLIGKGDEVSGIYFLLEGTIKVFSLDEEGREVTLYELNAGEICILALSSVFASLPYPASVSVSSKRAHIIVFSAQAYARVYKSDESARDIVFSTLSKTVLGLMNRLDELTLQSVDQRLLNFIQRNISCGESIAITHEQIAEKIGSTREVVSRTLSKLNKESIVKTARGKITRLL
jgi:CRP/FNR family transcriptional regulator, anaerobic regulatory protein